MNKKHVGSDLDNFLAEYGLLTELETTAIKRVIAYLMDRLMGDQG